MKRINRKKLLIILSSAASVIIVTLVLLMLFCPVSVTLYNGNTKLNKITGKAGTNMELTVPDSPQNMYFSGWYSDKALTKYGNAKFKRFENKLYAKFSDYQNGCTDTFNCKDLYVKIPSVSETYNSVCQRFGLCFKEFCDDGVKLADTEKWSTPGVIIITDGEGYPFVAKDNTHYTVSVTYKVTKVSGDGIKIASGYGLKSEFTQKITDNGFSVLNSSRKLSEITDGFVTDTFNFTTREFGNDLPLTGIFVTLAPGDEITVKEIKIEQTEIVNETVDMTDYIKKTETEVPAYPFETLEQRLDGRTLVWGDEFNSGTFADRSDKFSTKADTMTPDYKNGVLKCSATEEFIYVANGCLNLHAKDNGDNTFTTARPISTYKTMGFLYGYVEMRARVPFGSGYFPSFWMQTLYNKSESGAFAEVDMFESFGSSRQIQSGLSKWFAEGHSIPDFNSTAFTGSVNYTFTSYEQARDWHTYALKWTPEKLKYYIDGYNYFSVSIRDEDNFGVTSPGMEVFRQPAQLSINHWLYYNEMIRDNFRMDETVNYEIDYIRLYQKQGETLIIGE